MKRPTRLLPMCVAGAALFLAPALSAADGPTFAGPAVVAEAADFASEVYGDAWDYNNRDDALVDNGPVINARNVALRDGRLHFDASGPSHVSLLFPGYDGGLPIMREGMHQPIDANRYRYAVLRLYASARSPGGLSYQGCGTAMPCRKGNVSFVIEPGWHTYRFTMVGRPDWSGEVTGLRLAVSPGSTTSYQLDWLRLLANDAIDVVVQGGGALYWDADDNRQNNTADEPGWGPLTRDGQRWLFPAAAHPPGTYRFYGDGAHYSAALDVRALPRALFERPSEFGGEDYATATRGDAWDMDKASDVAVLGNAAQVSFAGGVLQATNAPPEQNDPYVQLAQQGAINADRYHRLEVQMDYDGAFDLRDAPGGGAHGRLIWSRAQTPTSWEDSKPFVTYTTIDRYLIDLHTTPRSFVAENNNINRIGWTGQITRMRWDPNEDRGQRRWRIDGIWLRADDESRGAFDVSWRDVSGAGATVSLYADNDRSGFDGVLLEPDITQVAGRNLYRWSGRSLAAGSYWLYAVSDNGLAQTRTYASGPLRVNAVAEPALRIAGPDRIATAVALSKAGFAGGANAVVVARDRDFPDALAAVPLAAAAQGPLLLNPKEALHSAVRQEVARLGAQTVYLMGGSVAQSATVEAALKADGLTVVRLAGSSRYATAALAAREAVRLWGGSSGSAPLLASGTSFPDALAAGPLAAALRQPLLLTYPDAMPAESRQAAADFAAQSVTVLGGEKAVQQATAQALGVASITRISGPSRYDTAVAAAQAALAAGAKSSSIVVASGESFADALAAGPLAVQRGGLLLIVGKSVLPEVTHRFLHQHASPATWLRIAGGSSAIQPHVLGGLADAAGLP